MPSWIESLNVNSWVKELLKRETDQLTQITNNKITQLSTTQNSLKTKVSAYGQLQSFLDKFTQNIGNLSSAFAPTYQATSSNTAVATVGINGSVTAGTHNLSVTQLAQAASVASSNFTSMTTDLQMTNTLTFTVGSSQFNVQVNPGDNLQTVMNNINTGATTNNVGVSASIISTGSGAFQLVIASTNTGVANQVSISETGTGSNALNISTGTGGTGTVLSTAQNAKFTLDGLNYIVPANSNTVSGLQINLVSTGSSTLTVAGTNNVQAAQTAVTNVVNSYNDVMTYLAKVQATTSAFDPTFSQIQTTLQNIMTTSLDLTNLGIVPVPYNQVTAIPVTLADGSPGTATPTGLLKLDVNPATGQNLTSILSANFSQVQAALTAATSAFNQANALLTPSTGAVWISIRDPQYGALPQANLQISNLQETIDYTKRHADDQKQVLIRKYAQLDELLVKMQVQSQQLSSQLAAFNNKG